MGMVFFKLVFAFLESCRFRDVSLFTFTDYVSFFCLVGSGFISVPPVKSDT